MGEGEGRTKAKGKIEREWWRRRVKNKEGKRKRVAPKAKWYMLVHSVQFIHNGRGRGKGKGKSQDKVLQKGKGRVLQKAERQSCWHWQRLEREGKQEVREKVKVKAKKRNRKL